MPHARFYVILNPTAGGGAAARAWPKVQGALEAAGATYELAQTERRWHAAELAEAAARGGWPAVLAMGGDGTINEVVNGLMRAADGGASVPLGIVPVGSGNDFAKLAGEPADAVAAVRRALAAEPRAVDVGPVGERWFANGVGVGLDARVAIEVGRSRRSKGMALYLWALAKVLRGFRPPRMRVALDGAEWADRPFTLVTVGNGGCHGGGFWICPDACIDDGALDVCAADGMGLPRILDLLPRVMRGTHTRVRGVHLHRARSVRIESADPLPVHADGEIIAEAAHLLDIRIHPGRLLVLS